MCVCVCVCDARTKALILGKLEEIVQVLADNNTGLDVGRERHCAFVGWSAKNKTTTTTKKKQERWGGWNVAQPKQIGKAQLLCSACFATTHSKPWLRKTSGGCSGWFAFG